VVYGVVVHGVVHAFLMVWPPSIGIGLAHIDIDLYHKCRHTSIQGWTEGNVLGQAHENAIDCN
jgi:hypothetical protein